MRPGAGEGYKQMISTPAHLLSSEATVLTDEATAIAVCVVPLVDPF